MQLLWVPLLLGSAISLSFASVGETLIVHSNKTKLVAPFTLKPARGKFVASLRCVDALNVNVFYNQAKKNACNTQMVGTTAQINALAQQIAVTSFAADAKAQIDIHVQPINGGQAITASQKIFTPTFLRFIETRNSLKFDRTMFHVEMAIFDPAYLTPESEFVIRPVANWPGNLGGFTNGVSFSLYISEPFGASLGPENAFETSFEIVDKTTGLVSPVVTMRIEVTPDLLPPTSYTIKLLFITLIVSAIIIFTFFMNKAQVQHFEQVEQKETEKAAQPVEISESASNWSKRVIERAENEKHNLSITRDTINESNFDDVTLSKVSAIDMSRISENVEFE